MSSLPALGKSYLRWSTGRHDHRDDEDEETVIRMTTCLAKRRSVRFWARAGRLLLDLHDPVGTLTFSRREPVTAHQPTSLNIGVKPITRSRSRDVPAQLPLPRAPSMVCQAWRLPLRHCSAQPYGQGLSSLPFPDARSNRSAPPSDSPS